jgi:hypothetical protein
MKYEDFYNHYEKLNDKETKKYWTYAEDYTWIEYYPWKHKIDFLGKFIKVFKNLALWEIFVDENIWLIVILDDMYIWEQFLDECIENKIYKDDAWDKWYKELEDYMDNK